MPQSYLCWLKEHFISDGPDITQDGGKSNPWEYVGIVTLTRVKGLTIQGHGRKRTPTGKNTPPLQTKIGVHVIEVQSHKMYTHVH